MLLEHLKVTDLILKAPMLQIRKGSKNVSMIVMIALLVL